MLSIFFLKGTLIDFLKLWLGSRLEFKDILCKRSCLGGIFEGVSLFIFCFLGEEELCYLM